MSAHTENRQVLYAKRPDGMPDESCFRIEASPIGSLGDGEVLVRNHYLSLDPYIRMRMEAEDSYAPVMKIGDIMVKEWEQEAPEEVGAILSNYR